MIFFSFNCVIPNKKYMTDIKRDKKTSFLNTPRQDRKLVKVWL